MRRRHYLTPMIIGLVVMCSACSLTSFQSPEVLDPGAYRIGADLSYASIMGYEQGIPVLGVFGRRGLVSNLEGGVRLAGIGLVGADLKYQVLRNPFYVATDLGLFGGRAWPLEGYSLIIAGTDRLYLGGRLGTALVGDSDEIMDEADLNDTGDNVSYGVLAGVALGSRSPLVLEVGLHHWLGEGIWTIGIGHRHLFGKH